VAAARQAAAPVILLKGERVEAMQCPACGDDELEAGGIELSWTLDEDLDPAEYGRDDYPEADLPDYVGPDTDDH
jgi:hypothetical protein